MYLKNLCSARFFGTTHHPLLRDLIGPRLLTKVTTAGFSVKRPGVVTAASTTVTLQVTTNDFVDSLTRRGSSNPLHTKQLSSTSLRLSSLRSARAKQSRQERLKKSHSYLNNLQLQPKLPLIPDATAASFRRVELFLRVKVRKHGRTEQQS